MNIEQTITAALRRGILALVFILPTHVSAENTLPQIPLSDGSGWTYVSDQVMGGVSTGGATFETQVGQTVLRLSGDVSTQNRGGFIQARKTLDGLLPAQAQGVVLSVSGNDETYFVHLRTSRTLLPWQYYQASFDVTGTWSEVRIPFADFAPSGRLLPKAVNTRTVKSLGIVAYGHDHTADLLVRSVGFY